ncbi:uncharacterized protein PGTG_17337 [Puccinia graminis f. sp. tritici CRL 75-36-700-3]|uniref:Myb/SANT-like domain-containing protein n=1 Tax=Puccinia graminis f. sp. tritici (strain CRL 75-36-700-3 / race SCCL) TaxID=418459 RepID=E3L4A6_PUCGT|nr:uncharacterized protein PGTG_17337 [Puccinia graminis f. sp. tritici CRL 75-36-700-3]EFP91381.1 hypothetical protein PGTG_17337 [Puccinia graminis f. sp. tritici CRL 75-36-700-3]
MTSKSPAINSKSLQESAASNGNANAPHTWMTLEKCKLLELLYDEMSAGHATDNGNLKKEGWTGFLCEQSGFGWDDDKFTVTADQRTWDELIQAHPRRNFGKLKDKPFPIFELAERVFVGNFATGESVNKHVSPDEVPVKVIDDSNAEAALTAPTPTSKKRKNNKKKEVVVSSLSNTDTDVRVLKKQSESTSTKRIRETKGTDGLVGAINNASNTIASLHKESSPSKDNQPNKTSSTGTTSTHDSLNAQALKCLSLYFLNKVDDEQYI